VPVSPVPPSVVAFRSETILTVRLPDKVVDSNAWNKPPLLVSEGKFPPVPTVTVPEQGKIVKLLIVPPIGKAVDVRTTEAGVAAKEPEVIPTLGVITLPPASCATTKYCITSPAETLPAFNDAKLIVNEKGEEPLVVCTDFHPVLSFASPDFL